MFNQLNKNNKFKSCACGCGKKLDMVGASQRKFWYDHEKIGEGRFWFYFNHPPKCKCGCGEFSDWDDVKLLWKNFKDAHEKHLSEPEKRRLLRKRFPKTRQCDLFTPPNGSIDLFTI